MASQGPRERLRMLGQGDLGAWIEVATGRELWSIQKKIARSVSKPRSRTAVPSCNASGKTHLAGRLALAFYDAFQPGTPCEWCGGPCQGAKVITTSSKEEHLKQNLWGELRMAQKVINQRIGLDGRLLPRDTELQHLPNHFIIGQTADTAEGFQGYHAAHKLIIGDEATAVSEEVSQGITGLLASGDSRLLLIFNPTTAETYAARQTRAANTEVIKITAFDTPHFTHEHVPAGSNLITPRFLEELKDQGMGPGTYEWTTRVEANFWDLTDDTLIAEGWFDQAAKTNPWSGTRQLGVDIAPYGTSENTITFRDGNEVVEQMAFPAMRPDLFFEGPVTSAVRRLAPDYLVYDADGVGAGAIGYAEKVGRLLPPGGQVIPFRGSSSSGKTYNNSRSAWWWALRRRFENNQISLAPKVQADPKLRSQLTTIRYSILNGRIRVETKAEMKKRGLDSPDRGDGVMYAFALSEDLPSAEFPKSNLSGEVYGVQSRSDEAMWSGFGKGHTEEVDAVLGVPW